MTRDNEGFDRLQGLLLATRAGDEVRVAAVSDACGLSVKTCRTVLEGLERAGLMTRQHEDLFVRKSLEFVGS